MFSITLSVMLALCLDKLVGEAERFHPLVGFGTFAHFVDTKMNSGSLRRFKGLLALVVCTVPICVLGLAIDQWLQSDWLAELVFSSFILYICIGWRSLLEHAEAIFIPLEKQDLTQAKVAVSYIVSRDCDTLNETEIAVAATESVLENGADAIFAAIFWFVIAGVPGVICYRLVNTLDAMWGYKNDRYSDFGWAAARFDDALNYFPARLTAFSYALSGHTRSALRCWFTQARLWKSPNAGPVMASGAGAIRVSLGGKAVYHGATHLRPLLGLRLTKVTRANANSIRLACKLVNKSLCLWFLMLVIFTLMAETQLTYVVADVLANSVTSLMQHWFE